MLRLGLAISVLLSSVRAVCGQDVPTSPWFVRGGVAPAHVIPASPFDSNAGGGESIDWVPNLTLEVGRQTNGTQEWHHLYGLPAYGVGFSVARFRNGEVHGRPLEAYVFFSWPFASLTDRMQLTTDFGMGVSWRWQQVNDASGAAGTVLGSDVNALIDWGFYLRYLSTSRTTVYTGIDFTHRSNGGVVQPDRGLNVLGPKVAVRYDFARGRTPRAATPVAPSAFRPTWDLLIGGAGGFKNVVEQSSPMLRQDFGVFGATIGVQRHFFRYGKVASGIDVAYDGATGAKGIFSHDVATQWRAEAGARWSTGVWGGYEHVIGRFGVFAHLGSHLARGSVDGSGPPRLYQRFGWRYRISDRLWGTVAIRSIEGNKADSFQLGAGYTLPLD